MLSLKTFITALKDLWDEQNSIEDTTMAIYRHVEGMHYGRQRLTKTAVIAVCTKYSELCCSNCDQYAQR